MAVGTFAEAHALPFVGLEDAVHEGPASKRIITGYGFWIFLLSDIVMFSCFFAACCRVSSAVWRASRPKSAAIAGFRSGWR